MGSVRKFLARMYWRVVHATRVRAARRSTRALPARMPSKSQAERGVHRSVVHPAEGLDPSVIPVLFRQAEAGDPRMLVALFDDLRERDGHLGNVASQRALAVAGKPWAIVAGGTRAQDQRAAELLGEALAALPGFSDAVTHWLSSVSYSYAASEIEWGTRRRNARLYVAPMRFHHLHADRFRFARGLTTPEGAQENDLLLVTYESPHGEPLAPGQWMTLTSPGAEPLIRRGLLRPAVWNSAFKLYTTKNWLIYIQRVGIPFALAKLAQYQDEVARAVAEEVGEKLGEDGFAVIPESMDVEWKDGARADAALHATLIHWFDAQNSKLYYGATLANDNGGGSSSYALGGVHAGVRWENIVADAVRLADAFRECVAAPFVAFNGMDAAPPRLVFHVAQDMPPQVLVQVADYARNRLGLSLSAQQFRELLGFRAPDSGDDALAGALQGESHEAA